MAKTTPHKMVRIDEDVYEALAIVAKEMKVSTTWLINDLLLKAATAVAIAKK